MDAKVGNQFFNIFCSICTFLTSGITYSVTLQTVAFFHNKNGIQCSVFIMDFTYANKVESVIDTEISNSCNDVSIPSEASYEFSIHPRAPLSHIYMKGLGIFHVNPSFHIYRINNRKLSLTAYATSNQVVIF